MKAQVLIGFDLICLTTITHQNLRGFVMESLKGRFSDRYLEHLHVTLW